MINNSSSFATIIILKSLLLNLIDVLTIVLPMLLAVAFMTIIERKQLAAHQRRVGPNTVGYYGVLQPFADALKLILKETVIPSQSNKVIFYLAPVSSLIFIILTGSLNYMTIIETQISVWFIFPLLPVFIFYFIAILAETSRTPFDLQEAESELVAGFFTEHSSVPFVFFFLAEYSSIV